MAASDNLDRQYLTKAADMHRVLKGLLNDRCPLTILCQDRRYASLLLDTDSKNKLIHIDSLNPASGNPLLSAGATFQISGRFEGVTATLFGCEVKETKLGDNGGVDHFVLGFPTRILHPQRREAFRVRVPRALDAKVSIAADGERPALHGRLVDLSGIGGGCEFADDSANGLRHGDLLSEVRLTIADLLSITCQAKARNPIHDARAKISRCGLQFVDLSLRDESAIMKAVLALQQQALRYRNREQ